MRIPFSLLLCCCVGLIAAAPGAVRAQAKKAERVTFTTGDFVELRGYWYRGTGKDSATVILLHRFGGHCREDGWEALAENLNKKGFAVLAFDLRGHGSSMSPSVVQKFWSQVYNQSGIKSFRPGAAKLPDNIDQADFKPEYWPHLLNDVYAARLFVEARNDESECNSGRIILIGAEDGATLGAMFTAAECYRYNVTRDPMTRQLVLDTEPESRDILCCVWLSISNTLGKRNVGASLSDWLKTAVVHKENKIPMAFLYGEQDKEADRLALSATRLLKPGYARDKTIKDDKLLATGEHGVAKSDKLAGSKLLSKDLETEKWIVDTYLLNTVYHKKEKSMDLELNKGVARFKAMTFDWTKRKTESKMFVYSLGRGKPIEAKDPQAEAMLPVPYMQLGLIR